MVTFPWFPTNCTRSNKQKHTSQLEVSFWVLLLFYPWELFIACSKCQKMQDFSCTVYKIGFSLDAETQSFRIFCRSNYINLNLHCSFPFSAIPEFTLNEPTRRYFQLVCSNSAILEKRQSNYFANQTAIHKGKTSL